MARCSRARGIAAIGRPPGISDREIVLGLGSACAGVTTNI